jgi:hypothetical protein
LGTWEVGLYANDYAEDLRSAVAAVAKLPLDDSALIEPLTEQFPESADAEDESYTDFWFVVADQFHKRSIDCPAVYKKAIELIDSRADLDLIASLGADASDLKKRQKVLDKLRAKLVEPIKPKPRKTLKEPEALTVQPGDVIVYPTDQESEPFNIWQDKESLEAEKKQRAKARTKYWGAAVIAETGLLFGYYAWMRPIVLTKPMTSKPDLDALRKQPNWLLIDCHTLSPKSYRVLEVETVGRVKVKKKSLGPRWTQRDDASNAVLFDHDFSGSGNWDKEHGLTKDAYYKTLSDITS